MYSRCLFVVGQSFLYFWTQYCLYLKAILLLKWLFYNMYYIRHISMYFLKSLYCTINHTNRDLVKKQKKIRLTTLIPTLFGIKLDEGEMTDLSQSLKFIGKRHDLVRLQFSFRNFCFIFNGVSLLKNRSWGINRPHGIS